MTFKVFDAYGAAARPEATLRASGQIFLSRGILSRSGKEGATHVQLQFDEEADTLGIKLCKSTASVTETGIREATVEKSGIAVNLVPLLRYYNFRMPKAKLVLPVTFGAGLVLIDLKPLRQSPSPNTERSEAVPPKANRQSIPAKQGGEEFDDDIPF